jgi:uncharacterized protein
MKRTGFVIASAAALLALSAAQGQSGLRGPTRVLAFWSANVEGDHVEFARQALEFYRRASAGNHCQFESTTNWDDLNARRLEGVAIVLWLNDSPHAASQRAAFESYMEKGGGWIGFHAAGYNDSSTRWPWFVQFLGAVFYGNNWPPLAGWLQVEQPAHPVTRHLPKRLLSPDNEWYSWRPSPRADQAVKFLLTLEPANFPIGLKDTITGGDVPVAWSNTKYRMIYFNMGHGDKIFTNLRQNRMFEDALVWVARRP